MASVLLSQQSVSDPSKDCEGVPISVAESFVLSAADAHSRYVREYSFCARPSLRSPSFRSVSDLVSGSPKAELNPRFDAATKVQWTNVQLLAK
jgi:hypothetical protein